MKRFGYNKDEKENSEGQGSRIGVYYIGGKTQGYFLEEARPRKPYTYIYGVDGMTTAADVAKGLEGYEPEFVVLDPEILTDGHTAGTAALIAGAVHSKGARLIIYSQGRSKDDELVLPYLAAGADYCMFEAVLGLLKSRFERIFDGVEKELGYSGKTEAAGLIEDIEGRSETAMASAQIPEEIISREDEVAGEAGGSENMLPALPEKIAVFGIAERTGTTTIAVQFAQYYASLGKNVCLCEMNGTGYLSSLSRFFDVTDAPHGGATLGGLTWLPGSAPLPQIIANEEFDAYIFDYGAQSSEKFDYRLVGTNDLVVVVLSDSPRDLHVFAEGEVAPKLNGLYQPQFVLNLIHERNKGDMLDAMDGKRQDCHFSAYAPDPYILCEINKGMFDSVVSKGVRTKKSARKGWFFNEWQR
jgi:hypothetical protein